MAQYLRRTWAGGWTWRLILATAVLSAVAAPACHCVPACPGTAETRQPDGTPVTVILRGDEKRHWNEDASGYLIARSPKTRAWHYATDQSGTITPTPFVVGRADPAAAGLQKADAGRLAGSTSRPSERSATDYAQPMFLTTGTMKNLVVLVSFSDLAVAYTRQEYDNLFNRVGYTTDGAAGSVKDFYHEVSYNALTINSTVVEPVTLDYGYAYYGANDSGGDDVRPREMVSQALAKLEARGFDFTTVDGDADGWVDCLTIIHAGGGEEYSGNDDNYIWSHKWSISSVTYDGVKMSSYHTEPARRGWDSNPSSQGITRIGVVCHEMGHFLGLPDLYDYGYDSEGAGDFCLMGGGSWGGSYGNRPVHPSAWCKAKLSWLTPTVITQASAYSLPRVETSQTVYKIQGACTSNEYFLIENRQPTGFDQSLPGSSRGILIWHIDENRYNNDDQTHYKVDLEEASCTQHLELDTNGGDDADYYRSGSATSFSGVTCPNNHCYSGSTCGTNIQNVGPTGATMTFDVTTCTLPSVLVHPAGGACCVGDQFIFSVVAEGTNSYQWYRGTSPLLGATSSTYTIASVGASHAGDYHCVVTNPCGSLSSNSATLTVNAPPAVTGGPQDATTFPGGTASFSVTATGAVLAYQWQVSTNGGADFSDVSTGTGGTTAAYTTSALTLGDSGNRYRCVVSGICQPGAVSSAAAVTVANMTLLLSEGFESEFVDEAPVGWTREFKTGSQEWEQAAGDYDGGSAAVGDYNALLYCGERGDHETYLITPAISFDCDSAAIVQFWHKQTFWSPDQDTLTVCYRTSAVSPWVVLATYAEAVENWTRRSLTLPNLSSQYQIGFLGNAMWGWGVCIDDVVVLQTVCLPIIAGQPASQTVRTGRTAVFTVTANGAPPLTYQWRKNGQPIEGATDSIYQILSAVPGDTGGYGCVVTGPAGSVASQTAVLTVVEPSPTVAAAKQLGDGFPVALDAKAVIYAEPNFFYVEDDSRACGIRVEKTAHGLARGDRADIAGTLSTNDAYEHLIQAASVGQGGSHSITPLAVSCISVGGGDWNYDPHSHTGQRSADLSTAGVNNVGLLVRACGKFRKTGDAAFMLDDSSGSELECVVKPGTVLNAEWQYANVAGVISMYRLNGSVFPRRLLVDDIQAW